MKRKLINYDVFERMKKDSLSMAEQELKGAAPILAKALGVGNVALDCYGPNNVLFETNDGTYIHANYGIKNQAILFENIEQIVIDEETEQLKSKELLTKMLEAVMDEEKETADLLFNDYLSMPATKRKLTEAKKTKKDKKKCCEEKDKRDEVLEVAITHAKGLLKDWAVVAKNVLDYVNFKEHGSVYRDTLSQADDNGNIVALAVPTSEARTAKKLIDLKWNNMLNTELEVKRGKAKTMAEEVAFCKAVAELKRHNAISDNDALEETLEKIVTNWPNVLYLTQKELAEQIKQSLETVGSTNYDDQTCEFMAEGILRTAHNAFTDRVNTIIKISGQHVAEDCEDQYDAFQNIVADLYPQVDEAAGKEMKAYADLYEALRQVYQLTTENAIKVQTAGHLNELAAILKQEVSPNAQVAEEAADWLTKLIETNLEGGVWTVSNKTHQTVNGDHPAMAQKAKQGYTPASDFSGNWGDAAPVSDGKNYRGGLADEMRNRSWGNIANSETWPELTNPYIPKPFGDYSMKGEKGVDKAGDATSQWSSEDTWPALQNPYIPKAETPQSYKMKDGPETDLVVDL